MKKFAMGLLCLIILLSGGLAFTKSGGKMSSQPSEAVHPNTFFDSRYFTQDSHQTQEAVESKIYGMVVPHHLIAYELIAQVFSQLEKQKPPLIILIGPNHFNEGERIITSTWGWETPFGTVGADREVIEQLAGSSLVKVENNPFTKEHSMGNLMPFLKYYLPETKVVPIIFHHDLTQDEAVSLSEHLTDLVQDKKAVIIASIDFSHYLTNKEAQLKDAETLEILKNKNITRLFTLGDAHLDSPGGLATLLLTMEKLETQDFKILHHTNSGQLIGNNLIETTSYITMTFQS